jgi:hypothetical protein
VFFLFELQKGVLEGMGRDALAQTVDVLARQLTALECGDDEFETSAGMEVVGNENGGSLVRALVSLAAYSRELGDMLLVEVKGEGKRNEAGGATSSNSNLLRKRLLACIRREAEDPMVWTCDSSSTSSGSGKFLPFLQLFAELVRLGWASEVLQLWVEAEPELAHCCDPAGVLAGLGVGAEIGRGERIGGGGEEENGVINGLSEHFAQLLEVAAAVAAGPGAS